MLLLRNSFLAALVLITGCSALQAIQTVPTIVPHPPVAIPTAQPMLLNPVAFKVMNAADLKAAAVGLQNTKSVLLTLDPANYKNLSLNFVEIKRYIDELNAINKLLQSVVETDQAPSTPPAPVISTTPVTTKK